VGEGSKAEKVETLTMAPPPWRSHRGRHQPRDAHDVQHHQIESFVPLLIGELLELTGRGVSRAVDHPVDATVPVEGPTDEGLEVVLLRDRAREAEAPELLGQGLGLARGGHQRHRVAPACEFPGASGSHAAAGGGDDGDLDWGGVAIRFQPSLLPETVAVARGYARAGEVRNQPWRACPARRTGPRIHPTS
jgi:hypothetical protein